MKGVEWAAGFFSGEGSCYPKKVKPWPPRRRFEYRYLGLTVGQKNRRTLEEFMAAVGYEGHVIYNRAAGKDRGGLWFWCLQGAKAEEVMWLMFPYLSREKQWQFLRARRNVRIFQKTRTIKVKSDSPPSSRVAA